MLLGRKTLLQYRDGARLVAGSRLTDTVYTDTVYMETAERIGRHPIEAGFNLRQAVVLFSTVGNLMGGDIDDQARAIVDAMSAAKVKRLIFVASLGIYDEVPGKSVNGTAVRSALICRHLAGPRMPSRR